MTINTGDIFWLQPGAPDGADTRIPHPHVVLRVDGGAVTLCGLTTNLERVSMPGNILLEPGEANLPRQSVVEVSKVATVEAARLGVYIGTLDENRVRQIVAGLQFVRTAFLTHEKDDE